MYAPPMPLENPGVRALREGGARPTLTREMERMRNWALGQRPAAANPVRLPIDSNGNPIPPRNGDFTINPPGNYTPAGVGIPTQMPTGDWRDRPGPNGERGDVERLPPPPPPVKPGYDDRGDGRSPPIKPGMLPQPPGSAGPLDKSRRLTGRKG